MPRLKQVVATDTVFGPCRRAHEARLIVIDDVCLYLSLSLRSSQGTASLHSCRMLCPHEEQHRREDANSRHAISMSQFVSLWFVWCVLKTERCAHIGSDPRGLPGHELIVSVSSYRVTDLSLARLVRLHHCLDMKTETDDRSASRPKSIPDATLTASVCAEMTTGA